MKITLKLYATFMPYLPANSDGHAAELELSENAVISDVIEMVKLPDEKVHLILINGIYVSPDVRGEHALSEGDVLALWPAVAGGQTSTKMALDRSVEKELGYSVKEFLLTLNKQKIFLEKQVFDEYVEINFSPGKVRIFFLEETERRIASMRLPLLRVRMELFSLDSDQEKQFFKQFLRAFQKGGG